MLCVVLWCKADCRVDAMAMTISTTNLVSTWTQSSGRVVFGLQGGTSYSPCQDWGLAGIS